MFFEVIIKPSATLSKVVLSGSGVIKWKGMFMAALGFHEGFRMFAASRLEACFYHNIFWVAGDCLGCD
jgi:hypothetical protein